MDGWLGPGVEPTEIERRSILSRLSSCSVISSNPDGALRTRTARIEQVAASGKMLTVRLIGSGLYDDIIPNPRVIITARPAVGPHELIAVNGLARIQSRMETLAGEVPQIDATLEGATRSTLGRMQDDLRKLHNKIIQAAKRKDETLRRQFKHAQAQAFPGGHPQEREVAFIYFLNLYGPGLVERLGDELTLDMGIHWVVSI